MTIHPCTDDNLPAFVALCNTLWPDFAQTIEEVRFHDQSRDPRCRNARWIACQNGEAIGVAEYSQPVWAYDPRKFEILVGVLLSYRRQGTGSALYATVSDALAPSDPIKFSTWICETDADGLRFAAQRGFVETMREQQSRLDLASFDPAPFTPALERVARSGIRITNVAALREEDPDALPRTHALLETVMQDVPSTDAPQPVPYEHWIKRLESPNYLPEGVTVAVDTTTGEYVGLSGLWRRQVDRELSQGLTGVRRDYRRRGIALAMKLAGITCARQIGATGIRTDNEVNNVGMLTINQQLGFVPMPSWIELGKTFGPTSAGPS